MRIARTFTIEEDLVKKLSEKGNRSELINKILREYFDRDDVMQMNKEQLKAEIKIAKLKKQTTNNRITT